MQSDCNMKKLGEAVLELQLSGGKDLEIRKQLSGEKIISLIDHCKKEAGALVFGMSSIGPSTIVICTSDTDPIKMRQIGHQYCMDLEFSTKINTTGAIVKTIEIPKFVLLVGKPCSGKSYLCN